VIWGEKNSTAMSFADKVLIFSIVSLCFPLWIFLSNWHDFKGAYLVDRSQLSTTQGKITSATTYTSKWNRTTYYHYSIEYEFTFEGRVFRSDEVTFDDNSATSPDFAQKYIGRYKKGAEVTVYFDPKAPSFSVLEPENINDFAIEIVFSFFPLIGFAIFGAILLKRQLSRHIFKDTEWRGGSKKGKKVKKGKNSGLT
jgi:Protein of unknown function (DUF3592)